MTPTEASEPTSKNLALMCEAFKDLPDADLVAMKTAQPETAKGAASAQLLAEREAVLKQHPLPFRVGPSSLQRGRHPAGL